MSEFIYPLPAFGKIYKFKHLCDLERAAYVIYKPYPNSKSETSFIKNEEEWLAYIESDNLDCESCIDNYVPLSQYEEVLEKYNELLKNYNAVMAQVSRNTLVD